jgi:hypothetical protein
MRQLVLLALVAGLQFTAPTAYAADSIDLGEAVVALDGPWRFHTGDDPRWAAHDFDDSKWEAFDLTPAPGSHDGDVGLKNYVSGWAAHGHRGYDGFAWYRMAISVNGANHKELYLVGPAAVDNSYQVFFNGHLVGGSGDFSTTPPSIVSIQPRLFALPRAWWMEDAGRLSGVIAFRVFMLKGLASSAEGGGIHIAPLLGNAKGAGDHYKLAWLQTFEGYAVDAAEPFVFLALAVMALCLVPFDRVERFYPWLAATLVFLAAARANQPLYFLGQFETIREFLIWRLALMDALILGAWTMAWSACFGLDKVRWIRAAAAILAASYLIARLFSSSLVFPELSAGVTHAFASIQQYVRYTFLLLSIYIFYRGVLRRERGDWIALGALLSGAIGVFSSEVSRLGVPGIWFPYGVGVSRTEYTYLVFDVALFVYLVARLWRFVPRRSSHA